MYIIYMGMSNKRYDLPHNAEIKDYFENLKITVGLSSAEIGRRLGYTSVTISNLSYKLDAMTGHKLDELAKIFGVNPGDFLNEILALRKGKINELHA